MADADDQDGELLVPAWIPVSQKTVRDALLALASLGYVFTQQTALLLRVTLITMTIGLVAETAQTAETAESA